MRNSIVSFFNYLDMSALVTFTKNEIFKSQNLIAN